MTHLAVRLHAQLLSGEPATTVGAVVERLLAVQAQDINGARLSVRARSRGLVASDVDRALAERELVVTWVNRGTLHLVHAEDYGWLHALTTPQLATSNATRLRQEGVSIQQANRAVSVIEAQLLEGPRTRAELRAALESADVPVAGQAVPHLLLLATLRGVCVRGPVLGKEQAFVLVQDWLPRQRPVDRPAALGELGRRYLAGHGVASEHDLAKWAGISLGDARVALSRCSAVQTAVAPVPAVRLLGPFDELLMGWASRDFVLGSNAGVVTRNGVFRPVILIDGRASGVWTRGRGDVTLNTFGSLPATTAAALELEAEDVRRFLAN